MTEWGKGRGNSGRTCNDLGTKGQIGKVQSNEAKDYAFRVHRRAQVARRWEDRHDWNRDASFCGKFWRQKATKGKREE